MTMEGVVIWYSRRDFQAIIWCEDSRELGIATGAADWRDPGALIEVGDVVRFRPAQGGRDRICRDIHRLRTSEAATLLQDAIGPAMPRPARAIDVGAAVPRPAGTPSAAEPVSAVPPDALLRAAVPLHAAPPPGSPPATAIRAAAARASDDPASLQLSAPEISGNPLLHLCARRE